MAEVLALILTHDSPDDLVACIEAVATQTDPPAQIVVVDNASRPPVDGESLALAAGSVPTRVLRLEHNTGPAGGHARGMRELLDGTCGAAWVLDDDMIPAPDCLERLVGATDADLLEIALPMVVTEGEREPQWLPAWCGVLVTRQVVERVGVPREELFWWAEDTEYLQSRVPAAGVVTVRVPAARVHHRRTRATAERPAWKVYFEARNSVYYRLHIQRIPGWSRGRLLQALRVMLGQILLREDHKVRKMWMFVRGVFDGLLGRLGIRVRVP